MIFPRGTGSVTLAIVVMLDVSGDGTSGLCVRLITAARDAAPAIKKCAAALVFGFRKFGDEEGQHDP
jgi:hypothetical protein